MGMCVRERESLNRLSFTHSMTGRQEERRGRDTQSVLPTSICSNLTTLKDTGQKRTCWVGTEGVKATRWALFRTHISARAEKTTFVFF